MKTSAAGRASLTLREGLELQAYLDTVGVWTIGVGHTGRASPPVVAKGMKITRTQADQFLAADLAPMEAAVNGAIHQPMTQNQFDACVSLAFNIGAPGFVGSTVVHKFNAGDIAGAADAFLMWEKPTSLRQRRIAERSQFLTPGIVVVAEVAPAVPTPGPIGPHNLPAPAKPTWGSWFKSLFEGL